MKENVQSSRKAYESPEVEDFDLIGPLNILVQVSMDGSIDDFGDGGTIDSDL